ncbi:hypothetical protein PVAP13_5NG636501 [Panicum virgatum]|uniref:Uncharacterized protein n=1 Tax=Panicum virgatum TaxID=38727 RepID=A0A8T0S5G0_PANVG|nr:hypothetical protein PVAP13_5NG636501 [Panicum virgatum]KAG2594283.1 hypothetical protein PVAP13_5NG636501 [Panicum virgatum]
MNTTIKMSVLFLNSSINLMGLWIFVLREENPKIHLKLDFIGFVCTIQKSKNPPVQNMALILKAVEPLGFNNMPTLDAERQKDKLLGICLPRWF